MLMGSKYIHVMKVSFSCAGVVNRFVLSGILVFPTGHLMTAIGAATGIMIGPGPVRSSESKKWLLWILKGNNFATPEFLAAVHPLLQGLVNFRPPSLHRLLGRIPPISVSLSILRTFSFSENYSLTSWTNFSSCVASMPIYGRSGLHWPHRLQSLILLFSRTKSFFGPRTR